MAKSTKSKAEEPITTQDIVKAMGDVMSKKPAQVTQDERREISVLIDKYLSQPGGDPYAMFSKVTVDGKSYTLNEVLSEEHIDAPNTLKKLEGQQSEKMSGAVVKEAGGNINYNATAAAVSSLIENGADPNKPHLITNDTRGITLMHILARCGAGAEFEDAVKNHGGNPNVQDSKGNTPAHYLLGNTAFMHNIEYLKNQGRDAHILIDHANDLGVTRVAKTLNAMRHSGADFSLTNHDGKTASAEFERVLQENVVKYVQELPKEKVEIAAKKWGATIDDDGKIVVTDNLIGKVIGEGTNNYNWSGYRIIRNAIHDVTVDNKDAPVLYEGSQKREDRPMLREPDPRETGMLGGIIGKLFSGVELKEANPDQLQAMTQRGASQAAASQKTQIT